MAAAVVTEELRRTYEGREAVRGISLTIPEGEIFGLLGPNGAGKTTTLSMISTRIRPTSGDAWVCGKHVVKEVHRARRFLNVAPQEEAHYPTLTAEENLQFFARLYGVPTAKRAALVEKALAVVELQGRRHDRVGTFSGGMRRRLNLGCALVSGPRVVLLDEPTVGVDPQSRAHIFDAVRRLRDEGLTILYTTHYLAEAEELCDRIGVIDEGKIVALGTIPELLAGSRTREVVELRFPMEMTALPIVQNHPEVEKVEFHGPLVRIYARHAQSLLATVCAPGALAEELVQIKVTPVSLETIFMEITGKELRD
jgi:ABC-2 type transport system ATP-binding protein